MTCAIVTLLCGAASTLAPAPFAPPPQAGTAHYHVPSEALGAALRQIGAQANSEILFTPEEVAGKTAPAIDGDLTLDQALDRALTGSGLIARHLHGAIIIRRQAFSAQPDAERAGGAGDEIVVTGTRIHGAQPVGSHLIVVDRGAIDRSGHATTDEILKALPQNFGGGGNESTVGFTTANNASTNSGYGDSVNLRGLGVSSTLVLIDGNRPPLGGGAGTFVDLSMIPSSAIERIEVLADGASAIYGSDAVAGVVNVKLRDDFRGAETRFRLGGADGFDEIQASQLLGTSWRTGHATLGYEFYHRSRLSADDRIYATEDLRRFGGGDYRSDYANPATIIAADGSVYGVPRGQDGTELSADDLHAGAPNRADGRAGTDILPRIERQSFYASVTQTLTSWLDVTGQGFFADRHSSDRYFPSNYGGVVVTPANPFYVDPIGTGDPVTVHYDFRQDLGPVTNLAHVTSWGLAGSLLARIGAWSGDLHATYGTQRENARTGNVPNYVRLAEALADTDPATAYDLFGDGSFTNPQTIDTVRGFYDAVAHSRVWSTSLKFDGPLFTLPAGAVRMAVGGEYRHEWFGSTSTDDEFTPAPVDGGSAGFPLGRSITAGYAEVLVPVVAAAQRVPAIEQLTVSLAGRVEHYSDFGTTANPRFGLTWRPVHSITVRGTFGTSFRAPSFLDIRQGPGLSQYVPVPLPDPASATGTTNVLALFGNRPDIGPERATTWTAGLDVAPPLLGGATLTLTYFNIDYRDRIESVGGQYYSFLVERDRYAALIDDNPDPAVVAAYYADPNFQNPYGIAPGAIGAIIDGRTANLARVTERGLDFDLGYRWGQGASHYELGIDGTYLFAIKQRVTATAPTTETVSTIGNPVDLRLRGRASASLGHATIAGFVNFVDGYANTAVSPNQAVDSWTTVDVSMSYALDVLGGAFKGLRAGFSITNLLDAPPPYVENVTPFSAAGFDPEQASAAGRLVALNLVKSW